MAKTTYEYTYLMYFIVLCFLIHVSNNTVLLKAGVEIRPNNITLSERPSAPCLNYNQLHYCFLRGILWTLVLVLISTCKPEGLPAVVVLLGFGKHYRVKSRHHSNIRHHIC